MYVKMHYYGAYMFEYRNLNLHCSFVLCTDEKNISSNFVNFRNSVPS